MRHLVTACLVLVALIHLLPVVGVLGPDRLQSLYGITMAGPDLSLLMRHRAALFGLLGVFFAVSAFTPHLQPSAFALGFASVLSFLLLAWSTGDYNAQVARVVLADFVALVALAVGLASWYALRGRRV